MKGLKLLISKHFAKWDGKKILTKDGEKHVEEGVCDLSRHGPGGMKVTEEQLKELDGPSNLGKGKKSYEQWAQRGGLYVLKLPHFVEVWIDTHGDRVKWTLTTMIKMPAQPEQEGWCGNFNGDPKDDKAPKEDSFKIT